MSAARVARQLGPESGAQLVVPRKPGMARRAQLIAEEVGVDMQVLKITEGSIHLRFAARPEEHPVEEPAVPLMARIRGMLARLGDWIEARTRRGEDEGPRVPTGLGFSAPPAEAAALRRDLAWSAATGWPLPERSEVLVTAHYAREAVRGLARAVAGRLGGARGDERR
jgi:hypothetical protein